MRQFPPLVDRRILSPAQTALALGLLNQMDLLRLKAIARVYARGLPPEVMWEDLLQEALTRVVSGSRRRPQGVPMVAFVAGILSDPTPGPERAPSARQELIAIRELFADDPTGSAIIEGLAEGLSAEEIRRATGLSRTDYDSARRRIRRALLREGLTCERK